MVWSLDHIWVLGQTENFSVPFNIVLQEENGDYTYMEHIKAPVTHGSLLTMEGALQHDWQVRLSNDLSLFRNKKKYN